tara:strand:- start:160 stop:648 length:489 start_codon:yes stop_codon:yes gene_type:complete
MKKILFILIISSTLSSCTVTKTAMLVNTESGERVTATFVDSNATGGTCEATMPDGEILTGRYAGIRETDVVSFGSASGNINANTDYTSRGENILNSKTNANYSATGATRTVGGQGKAHAILYSTKPGSKLIMEIIVIYNVLGGGGYGDAKTNDGRTYKVIIE